MCLEAYSVCFSWQDTCIAFSASKCRLISAKNKVVPSLLQKSNVSLSTVGWWIHGGDAPFAS